MRTARSLSATVLVALYVGILSTPAPINSTITPAVSDRSARPCWLLICVT